MTTKSGRLNFRLPEEDLRELEAIRERNGLATISDVIREAVAAYLNDEATTWNSDKVSAVVPSGLLRDVETFIAAGEASDVSQAVTLALTGWVEEKKHYFLEGRDALREKVFQTIEERDTRKGMARTASKMRIP